MAVGRWVSASVVVLEIGLFKGLSKNIIESETILSFISVLDLVVLKAGGVSASLTTTDSTKIRAFV